MQDSGSGVSFERDIRPMFTETDVDHMEPMGVMLADFSWMSQPENAKRVYAFLSGEEEPRMPPGGPYWSDEQLRRLSDWIEGGYRA